MKYTLEELRKEVFKDVYNVYEVFQNFFGEEFVDLQFIDSIEDIPFTDEHLILNVVLETLNKTDVTDSELAEVKELVKKWIPTIYVWWPTVTITNEHNRSVRIQDLYAKIALSLDGTIPYEHGGFKLLRSTFSYVQFKEGYVHSHLPRLHHSDINEVRRWEIPCLGSGPIRQTILDLHNNNEEALWMLFCQELSLYVTVESLTGGPYCRLEEIGVGTNSADYAGYSKEALPKLKNIIRRWYSFDPDFLTELIKNFTTYYIEKGHLSFSYTDNAFVPGMSFYDFTIDISNSFIEWYNSLAEKPMTKDALFDHHILISATTANRKFYTARNNTANIDISRYEGTPLFTFKGKQISLHINNVTAEGTHNQIILLNHLIADFIIKNILKVINYRYENRHNRNQGTGEDTSTSSTKICYI